MIGFGVRRRVLQFVYKQPFRLDVSRPVVSFAFDDFPRTAYTVGGKILADHGVRGTYYTCWGLANSANHLGEQFRTEDLYALVADGHELASHTLNHVSSRELPVGDFVQDVRDGRTALRRLPGLVVSDNFAYPYGAVTAAAKRTLRGEMRSCRGTFPGVNSSAVDLGLLRSNPLYGDTEVMSVVDDLISEADRIGGWLIFYTHDVQPNPSAYGATPLLFEATVELVLQRSLNILSVEEVLAKSGARPAA